MNKLLCFTFLAFCLGTASCQTLLSNAQSCSSCHATASVCTQKTNYVTCSCMSGYIGNGINCTAISSCGTESCCPQGYTWDNRVGFKICADINECADNTLNKCVPSTTCVNKNGIHLCGSTKGITCSNSVCSNDQDCLNVDGTVQCADPCIYYQTLDGTSRLSNITSMGVFATDRYNFGWFRYTGSSGLRIQEGCVGSLKCGSLEPFSLNGSHPAIGDGVVPVPLNINSLSSCVTGATIPVKACQGGFYVYKFTGSLKFDVYCTDPAFTSNSIIPTRPPTTTTTTPKTTTPASTPTTTPTTTTTTTTTPTTTAPTTTTPTTTKPTTTTPATTTPTTTTPTTTTPTTTTPTTTTPTTTTPTTTTTTTPTTTTPTTTTPTTTTPTTTTPTTTTPTTTTPTTTTTTTTAPITTTTNVPTTSSQPEQNITVITMRSSSVVSVISRTETDNFTGQTSLEINETMSFYIEVKIITPSTIRIKVNSSIAPSHTQILVGTDEPLTQSDRPLPQVTSNDTTVANMDGFKPQLYRSKPANTRTITETFTEEGQNFVSTTTTTTITNEEIIVIAPPALATSAPSTT